MMLTRYVAAAWSPPTRVRGTSWAGGVRAVASALMDGPVSYREVQKLTARREQTALAGR